MAVPGYNWFLIVAAVIVAVLCLGGICYLIVYYQHPEDRNQAWLSKIVIIIGLELVVMAVLMFPLDVGNRRSCSDQYFVSACKFAIPMKQLWIAMYWTLSIYGFVIIPFAIFFYDADSEYSVGKRIVSAGIYAGLSFIFVLIIVIIAYFTNGYMIFEVQRLTSGLAPYQAVLNGSSLNNVLYVPVSDSITNATLNATYNATANSTYNYSAVTYVPNQLTYAIACIPSYSAINYTANTSINGLQLTSWLATSNQVNCDSSRVTLKATMSNWVIRPSIAVYVIALTATIGWCGFVIFGGAGFVMLPTDLMRSWKNMPKSVITKAEYIKRARDMAQRAKQIKDIARSLSKERQQGGGGRKWRRQFVEVQRQLTLLEEDNDKLVEEYPQGTDPDAMWVITICGYWFRGFLGIVTACLSVMLFIHIAIYMLSAPPINPFLNEVFIRLDKVFPLFGTAAFAFFCMYLISATVHGAMKIGMNFLLFSIHPMKPHATLMSSFLFNCMLCQLITLPVCDFCSMAFATYARDTSIQQIFGTDVAAMKGFSWLFKKNFFLYCILIMMGITLAYVGVTKGGEPYKKKKKASDYIIG